MTADMLYNFPRARFVDENEIYKQLQHIRSEVQEAEREVDQPNIYLIAGEVMDIYHSAETALRILEEKHGVNIRDLMFKVADKNHQRGYYAD